MAREEGGGVWMQKKNAGDNEVAKKPVLVSRFSSLHLNGNLTHAVMLALILTLAS